MPLYYVETACPAVPTDEGEVETVVTGRVWAEDDAQAIAKSAIGHLEFFGHMPTETKIIGEVHFL
jgi:hypothetical protein